MKITLGIAAVALAVASTGAFAQTSGIRTGVEASRGSIANNISNTQVGLANLAIAAQGEFARIEAPHAAAAADAAAASGRNADAAADAAAARAAPYMNIERGAFEINDGAGSAFAILSDNVRASVSSSVRVAVTRTSVDLTEIDIEDSFNENNIEFDD